MKAMVLINSAAEKIISVATERRTADIWADVWRPAVEEIKKLGLKPEDYYAALARLTEAMKV